MPFYDFWCNDCKKEFRDVRKTLKEFLDGVECPDCHKKMETLIDSVIPFILNGNGWTKKSGVGREK